MPNIDNLRADYEASILAYERAYAQYTQDCHQRDVFLRAGNYGETTAYILNAWRGLRTVQQAMNQAQADYYNGVVQRDALEAPAVL